MAKRVEDPGGFNPAPMHNAGNYVISPGILPLAGPPGRSNGVDIFPVLPPPVSCMTMLAPSPVSPPAIWGSMPREKKTRFYPGMNLLAKYTLFAEGCRGHLGKQLIANYQLDAGRDPQHYALGIKELWEIAPEKSRPGGHPRFRLAA